MAVAVTPARLAVLRLYLDFEASLGNVRLRLQNIRLTRHQLTVALQRCLYQRLSKHDLAECAEMLFLNLADDRNSEGEDLTPEWLAASASTRCICELRSN